MVSEEPETSGVVCSAVMAVWDVMVDTDWVWVCGGGGLAEVGVVWRRRIMNLNIKQLSKYVDALLKAIAAANKHKIVLFIFISQDILVT